MRAWLQNLFGGVGKFSLIGAAVGAAGAGGLVNGGLDGWTVRPLDFESKREALNMSMMRLIKGVCGWFVVGCWRSRGWPVATRTAGAGVVGRPGGGLFGRGAAIYINGFAGAGFTGKGVRAGRAINL